MLHSPDDFVSFAAQEKSCAVFVYLVYMAKFLIGVDEAGRGPLAGPVAIGLVAAPASFAIEEMFPGVGDSKILTPKKREEIYALLQSFANMGALRYTVLFSSSTTIDRIGISKAVSRAVHKGVRSLAPDPTGFKVLLDGLLRAPEEYAQETIIRGDATEPIISLASIAAKVERDRFMQKVSKQFPKYNFETHKGYGTKMHRKAIQKFGMCDIHRRSYCRNVLAGK